MAAATHARSIAPDAKDAKGPRRARRRRAAFALLILLGIYAAVGFLVVPWVIRGWIIPAVAARLTGTLEVAGVAVNPFAFSLTLEGVRIRDAQGAPVLEVRRVLVDADPVMSLLLGGWRLGALEVDGPTVAVDLAPDGTLNLAGLLRPDPAPAPPGPVLTSIPRIVVGTGRIDECTIRLSDRSGPAPFTTTLDHLGVRFDSIDLQAWHRNEHRVTARLGDGAAVEWTGTLLAHPLDARGKLSLSRLALPRFQPYVSRVTTAVVESGLLSAEVEYTFAPSRKPLEARIAVRAADLEEVRIRDGDHLLLDAPRILALGLDLDVPARSVHLADLRLGSAAAHLVRDADGRPAILRLFPWLVGPGTDVPAAPGPVAGPEADVSPYPVEQVAAAVRSLVRTAAGEWRVDVDSITLHEQRLRFTDESTDPHVELDLTSIGLVAGPIRSAERFAVPFRVRTLVNGSGGAFVEGRLEPLEIAARLGIRTERIPLPAIGPYIPRHLAADWPASVLSAGALSADGTMEVTLHPKHGEVKLSWSGEANVDGLLQDTPGPEAPLLGTTLSASGDAEFHAPGNDTLAARWKGKARIADTAWSVPVAQAPMAGSLAALQASGEATLARAANGHATIGWNGEATASGFRAAHGSVAEAAAESARAKGTASVETRAGGALRAVWTGEAGVEQVAARHGEESAQLGGALQNAVVDLSIGADGSASLSWKGQAGADGASARAPAGSASLQSTKVTGEAVVRRDEAGATTLRWHGAAAVERIRAEGKAELLSADAARADGVLDAALATDGGIRAEWHGRADAGAVTVKAEGRADASVAACVSDGALQLRRSERDGLSATWDGSAEVTTASVAAQVAGSAATAAIGGAGVRGRTQASLRPAGDVDLSWKGSLDAKDVAFEGRPMGPVTAALGAATLEGGATVRTRGGSPSALGVQGTASASRLRAAMPERDGLDVALERASVTDAAVDALAPSLAAASVELNGLAVKAARPLLPRLRESLGAGEIDAARRQAADAAPAPAAPSASAPAARQGAVLGTAALPDLRVGAFSLRDGSVEIRDLSTSPPAVTRLDQLQISAENVTTRGADAGTVDLRGRLQGSAELAVKGSLIPADVARATSLDVSLAAVGMRPWEPYSTRFVGHRVESGHLSFHVPVTIRESALDGTLDASLDRLHLGDKVPSEEAIALPVKLGLDLLRDGDDRITVNIPFAGNLNDPTFDIWGVVWKALLNILIQASTAPFKLLGALVGAEGADLSQVAFEPGSAALTPAAGATLDSLADALSRRPALRLALLGDASGPEDLLALRRRSLAESAGAAGAEQRPDDFRRAVDRAWDALPAEVRRQADRDAGGRATAAQREAFLLERVEIPAAALEALATARAEAARQRLVETGGVAAERVETGISGPDREGAGAPRVAFELR